MKLSIYIVGIITGIVLFYLYFDSSTFDKSTLYQKQLKEKSEEVESVTHKNSTLVHEFDILREENTKLSLDVEHLQIQLSEYKSILNQKEKEEHDHKLTLELLEKEEALSPWFEAYSAVLNLTEEQQHQIGELKYELYLYRTSNEYDWRDFEDNKSYTSNINKQIKSILSDEQNEAYETHANHLKSAGAKASVIRELGKYPASMNLTEKQKDFIFQNLYQLKYNSPGATTREEALEVFFKRQSDSKYKEFHSKYKEFDRQEKNMIQASEEVLTEEQMEILIQSLKKSKL